MRARSGDSRSIERLRQDALELLRAGLRAADPAAAVRKALRGLGPRAEWLVVAYGKAAVGMASAAVEVTGARRVLAIVDRRNFQERAGLRVLAAGHPLPDANGLAAAGEVSRIAAAATAEDVLLVLASGGGSALLPSPPPSVSLADKVAVTRGLLASGATIYEINTVRKHLSRLKGGGLARLAWPARVTALVLSDVVGDDLGTVAGGCTVPDPTTFQEAAEILSRHRLLRDLPGSVSRRLAAGRRGEIAETPKPGDPIFDRVTNRRVGGNRQSLEAVSERAEELGYHVSIASRQLCGEAREAAATLADSMRRTRSAARPVAILAGGETTVTVRGTGRGGRNQELALALAIECERRGVVGEWVALSAGTDGIDGTTDAAGGLVDSGTPSRIRRSGLDPVERLADNDSHRALAASGDLVVTGSTGTNVADLQVILMAG